MISSWLLPPVSKGGPGSGPHPGAKSPDQKSAEAKSAGKKALASGKESDYRIAASLHREASSAHRTISSGNDMSGVKADVHAGQANRFDQAARYAHAGGNPAFAFSDK